VLQEFYLGSFIRALKKVLKSDNFHVNKIFPSRFQNSFIGFNSHSDRKHYIYIYIYIYDCLKKTSQSLWFQE
jgi:hypothetical protein